MTCANRVILIDLWWNHSIEMQAFSRVFRIGQTKETYFQRIIVNDSIDERMEELQLKKLDNIGKAMAAEKSVTKGLTVREISSLFGHLKEDVDGNMEVVADYNEPMA